MEDLHGLQTVDTGTSERIKRSPTSCRALWLLLGALAVSSPSFVSCNKEDGPHPNGNGTEHVEDNEGPTITMKSIDIDVGTDAFHCNHNGREGSVVIKKGDEQIGVEVSRFFDAGGIKSAELLDKSGGIIQNGSKVQAFALRVTDMSNNISEKAFIYNSVNHFNSLEDFRNLNIHAGEEVNFLNLIKFDGEYISSLLKNHQINDFKIKVNGILVDDPSSYIFYEPGNYELYFELIDFNGEQYNSKVNINVLNAEFEEPKLNEITEADILKYYSFYEKLGTTKRKDFVRPDILASYIAKSRGSESVSHIMTGEDPNSGDNARHAKNGTEIIGYFSGANVEYINGVNKKNRELTEERVKNDPEKYFVISCADDRILGETKEKFKEKEEVKALKRLLKYKNVIVVNAIGNRTNQMWQTLNENSDPTGNPHDGKVCYNSSSANTEPGFYNKFTVLGFDPSSANPYLLGKKGTCSNISCLPVGYNKENGNVVIFYIDTNDTGNTDSSYATAAINGVLTNLLQLYMTNHPESNAKQFGETLAKYLIPKELLCTDENGQVVNSGEIGYIIDTQKFLECEIWHCEEISNLDFNSDIVSLPYSKGIYYFGCPGFEYLDRETLERKESKELKNPNDAMAWRRNRETYGKYSNGNNLSIEFNVGQVTPKFDLILPSVKTYMKTISPLTELNGTSHEIRKSYYENTQTLTAEQLSTTFYNGYENSNIPSNNDKNLSMSGNIDSNNGSGLVAA